ncbi:prolyl oligopeptidase family serine peptidase [Duganella sp. FT80W]|uniref:Prolyl oligopeptidase family serine peptidase n=1 Tax=Duganella guangzhouensis TaxID=2666084 RepID=A0A6I2LE16_9BURK|nr:alpha/beta fold hydrolase [Duganella guangzhouensis]MRW94489.1 prolyl oligopeptidase family serine peptidase [Duganella guangzhouensis]
MLPALTRTAALLAAAFAANLSAAAEQLPIEQFFQRPAMSGASISPDGKHLALRLLSPQKRVMLYVMDIATRKQKVVAQYDNGDVETFAWMDDHTLAYNVVNTDFQSDLTQPATVEVDIDDLGRKPQPGRSFFMRQRSFADPDFDSQSYLSAPTAHGFSSSVAGFRVFLEVEYTQDMLQYVTPDNDRRRILAPSQVYTWLNDEDGKPRITLSHTSGKDIVGYYDGKQVREIASYVPQTASMLKPVLYAGGAMYVSAYNGQDQSAVYRYDLEQHQLDAKPLISVPGYDAEGYFLLDDHKILGYRIDTDSETTAWFDPTMRALQEQVDAQLPNTINTISVGSHSQTPYVLVDSHSDVQSNRYMLYDRDAKTLKQLGEAHPGVGSASMSRMSMIRYTARDGRQIPAYITLPVNGGNKAHPMVVLMGGTQWQRNGHWEWNDEVQFLASRGYVVLQPDTRGTPGFGRSLQTAGDKQWGRAMQDDIADATQWAIKQGYADPARVCIAGGDYGGYAAMMGLARDPALFKCGISWSGIVDIGVLFARDWKQIVSRRETEPLYVSIGDPAQDSAQFKETSPLYNTARIKQPVLLAYGDEDHRVLYSEGRDFYNKLSATNPQVEFLKYSATVEDARSRANRVDLWKHIEAFLAKNLGPTSGS